MKIKHNKKRNTAFVYEALIRELTKAVIKEDMDRKQMVASVIKEHFTKGSELKKELQIYQGIVETKGLDEKTIQKILSEARIDFEKLNQDRIFAEQSRLINTINKSLGVQVYDNFVPNYKDLATVYSIFNKSTTAKNRVLLEQKLIENNAETSENKNSTIKEPIDNLVYKSFVKRFNDKYHTSLNESQKSLVTKFVTSFADDGLELKMFMNEEVGRLKSDLSNFMHTSEDKTLSGRISKIINVLEEMKDKQVDVGMVETILKVQQLNQEIIKDVSKS
tara:strand:- start:4224 stop:5054 length:831 start_codon:yes stop_codon:yes gene_type:complete